MYVAYHLTSDQLHLEGEGPIKYIYYFILISHILLSIGIIPLVLISYARAISKQFQNHKRIARITFPILAIHWQNNWRNNICYDFTLLLIMKKFLVVFF